jgi:hypothetical protein
MAVTFYNILHAIRRQIIEHVDLTGVGDVGGIPEDRVLLWIPEILHSGKEKRQTVPAPGIVISPGRAIQHDPFQGENEQDDVEFPVVIQIVDRESQVFNDNRIHAFLKWEQNVRQHFIYANLRNEVFDSDGYVDLVYLRSSNTLDERLFGYHHQMIMNIHLGVKSRGGRSSEGSL